MDPSTIKTVAAVAAVLISASVFAVQVWFRHVDQRAALRRSYDIRIDAQGELIKLHGTRIERLETRMEGVATKTDLAALDKSIVAVAGQVEVANERLKPFAHTVDLMQEFLLSARGRQPEQPA